MAGEVESLIAAHEWCADHPEKLEKHPGKWVAVVEGEIVATGNTYGAAYKDAKRKFPKKTR